MLRKISGALTLVPLLFSMCVALPASADEEGTSEVTPTFSPTAISVPTESSTPVVSPTPTSLPTSTLTPTPTPSVTPAPTPTPTPTQKPVQRVNVYRLYNSLTSEHLYTMDSREVSALTKGCWVNEGIGWVAPSQSQLPVYRLYHSGAGEHHYTLDAREIQVLTSRHGWKKEGVAWYSSPAKEIPVYRQFNSSLRRGQHHYTSDKNEYNVNNARHGWRGEGVAWYAMGGGKSNPPSAVRAECRIPTIQDPAARSMATVAQQYSSATDWLILINSSTAHVGVFQRSGGGWVLRHYWAAGPGADRTPTVKGQFTVGNRGYSFGRGYTCYYWTQFYGEYLFHSILYYQGTKTVKDGTLGKRVSHGCVRLAIENAKWIYDNIPRGTKVVSY